MKGIMFNEHFGLESAVLSGRKTQTRRVLPEDFNKSEVAGAIAYYKTKDPSKYTVRIDFTDGSHIDSFYQVGEVVAIRQSYETILDNISKNESIEKANYFSKIVNGYDHKGDDLFVYSCEETIKGWRNKMFVKNDLMPHRVLITNIRIERLQDISEEDCFREGIKKNSVGGCYYSNAKGIDPNPKVAFASLIDKVSGKSTWDSNPYVFVYDFELVADKTKTE